MTLSLVPSMTLRPPPPRAIWALLVVAACGGGSGTGPTTPPPPPPPPTPTTLTITQTPGPGVEVGDVVQLGAETRDAAGQLMAGRLYTWTSSAAAVATVSSSGRVQARGVGSATIAVATGTLTASYALTVNAPQVVAVGVFPTSLALRPAETKLFSATVLGRNGAIPGAVVTWSSADPAIATVSSTGEVTAVSHGVTSVIATSGSISRTRGVTVSEETLNLAVARLDFIQIAQTAEGDVPLIAGKATAVRLYPAASVAGFTDIPIRVTVRRGGATLFETTVMSGEVPVVADQRDDTQGIFVPMPAALDLRGASVAAVIDPDNDVSEFDEWDNAAAPPGEEPAVVMETIAPIKIRLVRIGPEGTPLANFSVGEGTFALGFTKLIYPASALEISVRSGAVITAFQWTDQGDVTAALNQLEIERLADGFVGHYYGIMPFSSIAGLTGLGRVSGFAALGTMAPDVMAHEIGHNMGLSHAPGCGASNPNTAFPSPTGQIGHRGWDPRTNTIVPATFFDVMGYCGNPSTTWISGNYYQGIYSVVKSRTPATTLRAPEAAVVPLAVAGIVTGGTLTIGDLRVIERANAVSPDAGDVRVDLLDADGTVVFTSRLVLAEIAHGPQGDDGAYAGIIPVSPDAWARTVRVRVSAPDRPAVIRER